LGRHRQAQLPLFSHLIPFPSEQPYSPWLHRTRSDGSQNDLVDNLRKRGGRCRCRRRQRKSHSRLYKPSQFPGLKCRPWKTSHPHPSFTFSKIVLLAALYPGTLLRTAQNSTISCRISRQNLGQHFHLFCRTPRTTLGPQFPILTIYRSTLPQRRSSTPSSRIDWPMIRMRPSSF